MTAAEISESENIIIENLMLRSMELQGHRKQRLAAFDDLEVNQPLVGGETWNLALPLFYRLYSKIFSLVPRCFTFLVCCQIWQGVEEALSMDFSSLLPVVCRDSFRGPDRKSTRLNSSH